MRVPLRCTNSILHCASLLCMIFASLVSANEHVQVHSVRYFPQAKLHGEINGHFLLNELGA